MAKQPKPPTQPPSPDDAPEMPRHPHAAESDAALVGELLSLLSNHCGERGTSEGAVETLKRIISERDLLFPIARAGCTRAILVTHVPAEGQTYDAGRRYELRLLEAKDGTVTVREVKEVDSGEQTLAMPFHVALSHAEREFATFLKPEMYR